jgi:hypothetical protein
MNDDSLLPCAEMRDVLVPAYKPCDCFKSTCAGMRWSPEHGHVPRGFCGAWRQLDDVELVLIVAEPGNPKQGESYQTDSPEKLLEAVSRYVYGCLERSDSLYHLNIRYILRKCWPRLTFAERMRRTWITESTLLFRNKTDR